MFSILQIKNIYKQYQTGSPIQETLDGVNLNLRDNEFVAILGPSDSDKMTLLNIIGGLDRYDRGDLIINGIPIKKYRDRDWDSYRNRTIGLMFQSYNLIPHQAVLANVELVSATSGISEAERREKAREILEEVGLGNQRHKEPNQMSGGQMQRIVIARALVNDPDILLTDEPTGALGSETSVQVVNPLRGVTRDRLVVMVTHNPGLAQDYTTRIVSLRDDGVHSDSNLCAVSEEGLEPPKHETMGKSFMSSLTSLSLSFNNLHTKKARAILTSFAGSIGAIGIALILPLSNGVSQYTQSTEEETLSEYPLQIQNTGFDITSMMTDTHPGQKQGDDEGDKIHVSQVITNMFSKIGSSDLTSPKQYLDGRKTDIKRNTNPIEYTYTVAPQIYSTKMDTVRQAHPDTSFSSLGSGSSSNTNNMMSSMMGTGVFYQMPRDTRLYEDQHDIEAGRWPKQYDECILVLIKNGSIDDFMLYTLGLHDYKELDKMVKQFFRDKKINVPDKSRSYSYKELVGTTYKLIDAADYYVHDKTYHVYKDKTEDKKYMKQLARSGENVRIVSVIQPNSSAATTILKAGIGYPAELTMHMIEQAKNSEIVKKQLAKPNTDVFTGKSFTDESSSASDMSSLFTVDTQMLKQAFSFDQNKLNIDMSKFDLSGTKMDMSKLPQIDVQDILSSLDVQISQEQLQSLITVLQTDFQKYMVKHALLDPTRMNGYFLAYLQSDFVQALIQKEMSTLLQQSRLTGQFEAQLQKQMQTIMTRYTSALTAQLQKELSVQLQSQFGHLASNIQDAIQIDVSVFSKAIKTNMNEEELSELMVFLMTTEVSSYDGSLRNLGYIDLDKPGGISIYPKNFESKQRVIDVLDGYSTNMEKVDEDKMISCTDYVGTLMSSVTDITNIISCALIAFAAISLVVSSIMIGVITYINVLKRKKEIGILRAIGTSKENIPQMFNTETFIIDLLAGLLGIIVTLLLLIPGNILIHHLVGDVEVNTALPLAGGVILIILSVILIPIGDLIPSRKTIQEDPITALRIEQADCYIEVQNL